MGTPVNQFFCCPRDFAPDQARSRQSPNCLLDVDEVNRLCRPDFVQFIGDNAQNAQEEEFHSSESSVSVTRPFFVLVGDHDITTTGMRRSCSGLVGGYQRGLALCGFLLSFG